MTQRPAPKPAVAHAKAGTAPVRAVLLAASVLLLALAAQMVRAGDLGIAPFVGSYSGSAEMERADGTTQARDMSVEISENKRSFNVEWTTVAYKSSGKVSEKSYDIEFVETDRDGVFAAAQRKNAFGHAVQLDPMQGEPYVWAQLVEDTLTVYSLYVAEDGGYEIQQFDRTLTEGGLKLDFNRLRNGEQMATISAFLSKD